MPAVMKVRDRQSTTARAAGIAYLITIAAGIFAEVYARGSILIANEPGRTTINFLASSTLYRLSILSDCLMILAYVVVTALLCRLFKPAGANVSFVAALMSLVGLALLACGTVSLLFPLQMGG